MKDLDVIREDVEIEMAKELASCRGDVYAEKEALWFALRDERVTKSCTVGDRKRFERWALWQDEIQPNGAGRQMLYKYIPPEFSAVMNRYYNIFWQVAWEAWQAAEVPQAENAVAQEIRSRIDTQGKG